MNILITSAGQRVSLIRAFKAELTKFYPQGQIFTTDMNPLLSPACQVSDLYFKVRRVTHPAYIQELLELSLRNGIKMIIPTIDTELQVLADNRALFSAHGIHVIVSSSEFVQKCRDKRKISLFFKGRKIDIPASIDKKHPTFPLFIKPYDGSLSSDIFLIKSPEELTPYHLNNRRLLFMEYIDSNEYDEYTVDMYYGRDHHVKCIVPRRRIAVRAGEINKGKTKYNEIVPFLKERMGYIQGAIGCFTTQVFLNKTNGHIIAIEINPRFGGGYPLSYHAGANYPAYLIREYFWNEAITYSDEWEKDLLMLRYDDEILVHEHEVQTAVAMVVHGGFGLVKSAN
jgi:carbamoyl-phosphate synthase large subunit